jgi:hypothetical protein
VKHLSKQIFRLDRGQCFTAVKFPSVDVLFCYAYIRCRAKSYNILWYTGKYSTLLFIPRTLSVYILRRRIIPDCHIKITSYKNVYSYFPSWFFFFSMLKRFGGTHRIEWGRFHSRENLERYSYTVHTHVLFIESSSSTFFPCSIWSIRNEIFFFSKKQPNPHRWTMSRPS